MQPIIFHIDFNSFFASVAQQDNPAWRGQPLGVCEHLGGIIIAASREAKKWGIKTGTPVWEARKLYPKIILTKTHSDRYRYYSDALVKVVSQYTGQVEQYSIDEVFLNMTRVTNSKSANQHISISADTAYQEAIQVAKAIKADIKKDVGEWLTCSIGIGENKLIAKIASDMQKPDGLVVVSDKLLADNPMSQARVITTQDLYNELKLIDIPGIGSRQQKNLNRLGIRTLVELRDYPVSKLIARFGRVMGYHLHMMGQLKSTWKPVVEQEETMKSLGHMYTLPHEYRDEKHFRPVLYKLCEMVAKRLRKQGLHGSVIHFHLRGVDYQGFGESKKLGYSTQDGREIFLEASAIYDSIMKREQVPVCKLIGVTLSGLSEFKGQISMFGKDERLTRVNLGLDKINKKYGDFTVCRVPVKLAGNAFQDSIGFGRIKEHYRISRV